jgi:CubicO group peptidase (beta-lactamase class C family)
MERFLPLVVSACLLAMPSKGVALDATEVVARLNALRVEANVPVLAVGLFVEGKSPQSWVLGHADSDTPLRWGSISKTFTALGLLQALKARGMDDEDPIIDVIPDPPWNNPWRVRHPMRYRDLTELCAGLSDLSLAEFNDNHPRPRARVLQTPRRLLWPPGLQHSYTNVAPGLSAWVIEQLMQEAFEPFVERTVLLPMGLRRASYHPLEGLPGGFKADGVTPIPYWHMTFPAAAGLNASLSELMTALGILLNSGKLNGREVLSADVVDKLFSPGCAGAPGLRPGIGYGAGVYGRVRSGHVFYGHGGDADGYRSRFGLLPEDQRGYVVLINTDNPRLLRRLERILEAFLTQDLARREAPSPGPVEHIDTWVGDYYPAAARFDVAGWRRGARPIVPVERAGDALLLRLSERSIKLIPVDRHRFRRETDPLATIAFYQDNGTTYLQGELGSYVRLNEGLPDWAPEE